jgi:lipid-A-disaccharide synthase
MQKIFIISGEASGDLHGSNLIKEIKNIYPYIQIQGWGGELMQLQGATILKHYKDLAFMGFSEVIKNLPTIIKNFKLIKTQINDFKPDIVVLIDYPGFNLRMAKWAKTIGYKTVYYISPQIWAWKENRIHQIKKYVDKMIVILPFEKEFYHKWNYAVDYVGHPLVSVINNFKQSNVTNNFTKTIALLPGSRMQEINKKLPIMLKMAEHFKEYQFIVAQAPGIEVAYYNKFLQGYNNVKAQSGTTYTILNNAIAALVTSGTATLETALFKVPQVVCYKGNKISFMIAKKLLKIKYISLVNLIMDKLIVEELIQDDFNEIKLRQALQKILVEENRNKIDINYEQLISLLSKGGDASKNAANLIAKM